MIYSREELLEIAETVGFRVEIIEKVLHLYRLLNAINSHPFLKGKFALKGGTAINLFLLNMPRLSVDIDLNYIAELDREKMIQERPDVEKAIQDVFSREGFGVKRMPGDEHAGGKWRLVYQSFKQQNGNLEIDLNYMYRIPLWNIAKRDSSKLGRYQAKKVPVLDIHELAAGKLAALLTRCQSRDLFDTPGLVNQKEIDDEKLRLTLVIYGGMSRTDWRTVGSDSVNCDPVELQRQLLPVIHHSKQLNDAESREYALSLVKTCKEAVAHFFPLRPNEKKFIDLLQDQGIIEPDVLTDDVKLQNRIMNHPQLQWKVLNVKEHIKKQKK
ncbi:MAG: nucleotidyl transferase AbiEii/AbiGii toxin family protein [Thermoguttaceae bacterium]|nr:nucleotidyl transferase AbiEii/AbiGii toxin family protein [Thermoguttaceae bacterium]